MSATQLTSITPVNPPTAIDHQSGLRERKYPPQAVATKAQASHHNHHGWRFSWGLCSMVGGSWLIRMRILSQKRRLHKESAPGSASIMSANVGPIFAEVAPNSDSLRSPGRGAYVSIAASVLGAWTTGVSGILIDRLRLVGRRLIDRCGRNINRDDFHSLNRDTHEGVVVQSRCRR